MSLVKTLVSVVVGLMLIIVGVYFMNEAIHICWFQ